MKLASSAVGESASSYQITEIFVCKPAPIPRSGEAHFQQTPWIWLCQATGVAPCKGEGVAERSPRSLGVCNSQSACLRRKAGISRSSIPPEDNAFTRSVAWVRPVRHTLGTAMLP